jgi:alpha/beta superfamily hydrolase
VGIGMGATDYKQPMLKSFPLDKIRAPVLDVYAEEDYPAVIKMAAERLRMIEQGGNEKSSQTIIKYSKHYYADKGAELSRAISEWLNAAL